MLGTNSNNGGGNRTFLKIFDGNIVTEWKEKPQDMQDVKERINKKDAKVYYKAYDFVEGELVNCELEESPYGEVIKLTILDGPETYVLDIIADSRYGSSFFYRMLGIDPTQRLRIKPYAFVDDAGKNVIGVSISQNGQKITYDYGEGVVPDLIVKVKGAKTTYDNTDRYNFFTEKFTLFKDKVKASAPVSLPSSVSGPYVSDDFVETVDDDLPF